MPRPRIVIIGAGAGDLAFAVALQKKFPDFDNFVIYEKGSDVGGTWRDNTYPGCSSDVAVHFYSLSTDLNPDWDFSHGSQAEISQYFCRVAAKNDLYYHIKFNTQVTSATWNAEKSKYIITTKTAPKSDTSKSRQSVSPGANAVVDGEAESVEEAEILISAIGPLEVLRFPDVPGIEDFEGNLFHAGKWDHSVDLKGKKVAVVGNATSAAQIVPTISEDPTIMKREVYTAKQKWWFRYVPLYMRLHRFKLFLNCEILYFMVFSNSRTREWAQKKLVEHIKKTAPEEYHDKLIPTYSPGCKRLVMDRFRYLKSMNRPNVRLNWDGIEAITEKGILTKQDERLPFDVIVFATGYVADDYQLHVKGRHETVKEYYQRNGGPMAYMGTTMPGFPNFFIVGGPNTGTGHTSFIYTEENQVQYILKLIEPVLSSDISSIEVSNDATEDYQRRIESRLQQSVFVSCTSWYRTNSAGRIAMIFPGSGTMFWWWFRHVDWRHYHISAKDPAAWRRKQAWATGLKTARNVVMACIVLAMVTRTEILGRWF
ncbi:hypothetical protein PQX77_015875 [Marasmius sp. AFHP31]|nr:hypothetical protein PQX77_015875 [Marasmius sp. AFHP31]